MQGSQFLERSNLTCIMVAGAIVASPALVGAQEFEPVDPGRANEIANQVDKSIAEMRGDLDTVAKGYGEPLPRDRGNKVERRLREGEIHFLLNDYLRASIVLLEVVDDESNRSHPRYNECVYFLAESLRKTENFSGARSYFEYLLPLVNGDRLKDVVFALLEISNTTGRYDGVDRYVSRLREAGGLSRPDVDYIHGKMLFRGANGDADSLSRAVESFAAVPADSAVAPQASYYSGVVLVTLQRVEEAIPQFREAAERAKKVPDSGAIEELSYMALGRLYHELGDISTALDVYQEIPANSPLFSDMLFEAAWTHVKAANSSKDPEMREKHLMMALRTSEILMASAPSHQLYPEARILEGNLQIQLGAPETAYDTFQTIIDRYGGARQKLDELAGSISEPREFFEQIVAADLRTVRTTTFLPPVAIEWAVRSPEVRQAVSMIEDIRDATAFLKESRGLIRTMNEALKGEQRYAMFTGLAESRAKAFSIENRMVLANRKLVTLERRMVMPYISKDGRAQLDVTLAKRRALEEEVQGLPQNMDQVAKATNDIAGQYTDVERRVFRQTYQVASMRAQVAAVEVWMAQNRSTLTEEQVELMNDRLSSTRNAIADIEDSIEQLQNDIGTARAISGGDGGRVRAHRLREAYSSVLVSEAELLQKMRVRLPGSLKGPAGRLDSQRKSLATMRSDLTRLQTVLDQQIENRVADVREQLVTELKRLEGYEGQQVALKKETDSMLGPVAKSSLRSVSGEFKNIVRKADVGIIDVAWARKQAETKKVNEVVQQQQERVRELDEEFADVLED